MDGERGLLFKPVSRSTAPPIAWHALPNKGLDERGVGALALFGGDLYVGGRFYQTGDGTLTDLGNIARCALDVPYINVYLPLVVR